MLSHELDRLCDVQRDRLPAGGRGGITSDFRMSRWLTRRLRPDFLLLHPHVGIAVFEVKDWDLDAMKYFIRYKDDYARLWCEDRTDRQFHLRDEPVEKVIRYKREILGLYCPRLGIQTGEHPEIRSVVTAGIGKSLALAARAAHLSAEGKQVLVVSFNLTLLHYLRDLAVRYPDPKKSIVNCIDWLHFHGWCKRVSEEAGMEKEYRQLWHGRSGGEASKERG